MNAVKFLFCAACLIIANTWASFAGEMVELRDVDSQSEPKKPREGLGMYISRDGSWFSDSGPTSPKDMALTFERWRSDGVEPGVILFLYPKLKSNSNLVTIKQMIDFLKEKKVSYSLRIAPIEDDPEAFLK